MWRYAYGWKDINNAEHQQLSDAAADNVAMAGRTHVDDTGLAVGVEPASSLEYQSRCSGNHALVEPQRSNQVRAVHDAANIPSETDSRMR